MGKMSTTTRPGSERESLLTRPFLVVTASALVFFVYIGMLIPIVPLFIEGPLGAGEFGIGVTVAVFAIAAILARQMPDRDKRARATHIVETLSHAAVEAYVEALLAHIRSRPHA